ncbi:MAG: TIGR04283 family arsenosugar biosynthesis glycosyltransferase [Deltaproteobacteria bacterium]|nr:TIGR04283 family arsenosugar biosynthesis glycosyltransferase [Deltaproteobacteria bacterium]
MSKRSSVTDRPEKDRQAPPALPPVISIVLPVLNEARILAETLSGLPVAADVEIILVDGGSTDGTRELAGRFPHLRLLAAPRGRGCQMNAGARAARGELLTFLHADTQLSPVHLAALRRAAADPAFSAGAFELALSPPTPALRFIACGANWRSRLLGLPYGDQVLTLRRDLFHALGGFAHRRPEDLDLVLRLKRGSRLRLLSPPVISSGRRWLEQGYFAATRRHWLALARHLAERLFTKGWPPQGELEKQG